MFSLSRCRKYVHWATFLVKNVSLGVLLVFCVFGSFLGGGGGGGEGEAAYTRKCSLLLLLLLLLLSFLKMSFIKKYITDDDVK